MGVGAAIAAGSQELKGNKADLVKQKRQKKTKKREKKTPLPREKERTPKKKISPTRFTITVFKPAETAYIEE